MHIPTIRAQTAHNRVQLNFPLNAYSRNARLQRAYNALTTGIFE